MKRLNKIATRIVEVEGYTFEELSKDIQDKLINENLESLQEIYNMDFQNMIDYKIDEMFPNSNVKYIYSFSYSQGDGFGLYGNINVEDAIKLCNMSYTKLETEILEEMICIGSMTPIEIYNNSNRTYFRNDMIDISESFDEEEAEYVYEKWGYSIEDGNFNVKAFCEKNRLLEEKLIDKLTDFCDKMEMEGYEYLYDDCEQYAKEELMEDTETLYNENGIEI